MNKKNRPTWILSDKTYPASRFVMTDDGLRPDLGPENGQKIEHHIISSVECVFEEERGANTPEP